MLRAPVNERRDEALNELMNEDSGATVVSALSLEDVSKVERELLKRATDNTPPSGHTYGRIDLFRINDIKF